MSQDKIEDISRKIPTLTAEIFEIMRALPDFYYYSELKLPLCVLLWQLSPANVPGDSLMLSEQHQNIYIRVLFGWWKVTIGSPRGKTADRYEFVEGL
jgi:hypothetical protein